MRRHWGLWLPLLFIAALMVAAVWVHSSAAADCESPPREGVYKCDGNGYCNCYAPEVFR